MYDTIPESEQENVLHIYWQFLRQAEEDAYESKDPLDRHLVEAGYNVWNRVNNEDKKPRWMTT